MLATITQGTRPRSRAAAQQPHCSRVATAVSSLFSLLSASFPSVPPVILRRLLYVKRCGRHNAPTTMRCVFPCVPFPGLRTGVRLCERVCSNLHRRVAQISVYRESQLHRGASHQSISISHGLPCSPKGQHCRCVSVSHCRASVCCTSEHAPNFPLPASSSVMLSWLPYRGLSLASAELRNRERP